MSAKYALVWAFMAAFSISEATTIWFFRQTERLVKNVIWAVMVTLRPIHANEKRGSDQTSTKPKNSSLSAPFFGCHQGL